MNRPLTLGLAFLVLVIGVTSAAIHRRAVIDAVRRFFLAASHPVNLAVFRIVLFGLLAFVAWVYWSLEPVSLFGALPEEFLFPPYGTGWLVERGLVEPLLTPGAIEAGVLVLGIASVAAVLGVATRASAAVAALAALYVLGVPQLFGKVNHGHHLVWFAVLLAASPAGHALSVDELVRRWRGRTPGGRAPARAYGFPIRIAWLLIGIVYLFPGITKFATVGLKWALSDNLANRVLVHHAAVGREVPAFVQSLEPVLPLLALAAMVLEIAFVFLLFSDRLRPYALVAMLLFHVGTYVLLRIWFFHLIALYVIFVDWHGLAQRWRSRGDDREEGPARDGGAPARPRAAVVLVAVVLVLGAVTTGARGIVSGWPFASYPTFANLQAASVSDVVVEVAWEDDRPDQEVPLPELLDWLEPSRVIGLTGSVLNAPDRERRLAGIWELMDRGSGLDDPDEVEELRFYRVVRDLRRADEPPRRELLHTASPEGGRSDG